MKSSKGIALIGVLSALMIVCFYLEVMIGVWASATGSPPAILSISLAISVSIYAGWKNSFTGGTILGVTCFIIAFTNPIFAAYMNPLVSILPRVLIGVAAYWAYSLAAYAFRNSSNKFIKETLPLAIAGAVGVITNTSCVLLMLSIFQGYDFFATLAGVVAAINFPLELIGAVVIVPTLVTVIKRTVVFGETI